MGGPASRTARRPPKASGPREEQFIYVLPLERQRALADRALGAAARAHERFWTAPPEEAAAGEVREAAAPDPARVAEPGAQPWSVRRGARAKAARASGRRFGTVSRRTRAFGDPVPDLRISGFWLKEAGFDVGQEVEIEVEAGTLVVRAVPAAPR
jgi:hypothetical protein